MPTPDRDSDPTGGRSQSLAVVVVNWNGREHLARCLASLGPRNESAENTLEILVVDNGSHDGSRAMVRRRFPQVALLEAGENLGFAEGCNRGIAATSAPWVLLLNNDAIARPGFVASMLRATRGAAPDVGMLQALMVYRDRPAIINSSGIAIDGRGSGRDRDEGRPVEDADLAPPFCPTAGAAAYRRTMLEAIALEGDVFDAAHFMYYEDLDLGWRARLAGWEAALVPDAIVEHVWHGTSHRHGDAWLRRHARINRVRTLIKNASWPMLAKSWHVGVGAALELGVRDGPTATLDLARAAVRSFVLRRQVERLRRVPRRALERRWVVGVR